MDHGVSRTPKPLADEILDKSRADKPPSTESPSPPQPLISEDDSNSLHPDCGRATLVGLACGYVSVQARKRPDRASRGAAVLCLF